MRESEIKYQECQELANLKYKTMLLNGTPNQNTVITKNMDSSNMELLLSNDKEKSQKEPWSKLDQSIKIKKIS